MVGGTATTTCSVPANLVPGSYVVTASYSGANNFAASAGTALLSVGLINSTVGAVTGTVGGLLGP